MIKNIATNSKHPLLFFVFILFMLCSVTVFFESRLVFSDETDDIVAKEIQDQMNGEIDTTQNNPALYMEPQSRAVAPSIKSWSKTVVASDNVYAPAKYSVVPLFVSGRTTIRTFGKEFTRTTENSNGTYNGYTVRTPSNSEKGKFGVFYDRIATYQGKDLSLKATVMDWSIYNTAGSNVISFGVYAIGLTQTGYNWVDINWEFYYTDTNQKATDIQGSYMNVIDIDALQGIEFDKSTVNNIEKVYATNDSWIKYKETNGAVKFYESDYKSSSNTDEFAIFTVLFNQGHTFRFKWHVDYTTRGTNPKYSYPTNHSGNEYFGFNGQKLVATELISPTKYIVDAKNNKYLTSSTIGSINDTFKYEIYHNVPDETAKFYYKSYQIEDKIPSGLLMKSFRVLNQKNQDVTNKFTSTYNNNVLQLTAKSAELSSATFYNSDYKVEISVGISTPTELNKYQKDNVITFNNQAKITTNNAGKTSSTVSSQLKRRKIVVNHIDAATNAILKTTTEYKYDGESYNYTPLTDIKDKDGGTYKSTSVLNGTTNGLDLVLTISYHLPVLTINVDRIQIDTAKSGTGGQLPATLYFSKNYAYEKELANVVLKTRVTDTTNKKTVYEDTIKVANYQDVRKIALPADYLSKGAKVNYSVTITVDANPDDVKVVTETKDIQTHAYTSSEKVLTNSDIKNNQINYSAVVRTIKERTKSGVQDLTETVSYAFESDNISKTGYGVALGLNTTYKNETNNKTTMELHVHAANELIDSYINKTYPPSGPQTKIKLDMTKNNTATESTTSIQTMVFEFPHMNVEMKTGNIFTDEQRTTKDSNIKYTLIDGGRKLYVPIWANIGEYSVLIKSNNIGSNLITIDMTKRIIVSAHLLAHSGSETLDKDEIMLTPVDARNDYPDDIMSVWSESDINWLQGDN